jgi:hypothetical protein
MRTILLVALFAVAVCVQAGDARAQAGGVQAKPAPTTTVPTAKAPAVNTPAASTPTVKTPEAAVAKAPAKDPAAEIAARPDGFRYYWHNGEWWYFTAQNTWLRWNGKAWVVHHSINDAGVFGPARAPQPSAEIYAPAPDGSYRYQINRRKGGL